MVNKQNNTKKNLRGSGLNPEPPRSCVALGQGPHPWQPGPPYGGETDFTETPGMAPENQLISCTLTGCENNKGHVNTGNSEELTP